MRTAAEKVLDEGYLPSHSEKYRDAYHPAYRVLWKDYRKFRRGEDVSYRNKALTELVRIDT